eukprot:2545153-Rhodomonas_salina.4
MFYHAYDNYMLHAFPHDELRPLSCHYLVSSLPTRVLRDARYFNSAARYWPCTCYAMPGPPK